MSILNYSTNISADKTSAEIQRILATGRAQAVLTEYNPQGILVAISFRAATPFGVMSFRLPADVEKVFQVMWRDPKCPKRLKTREQASRVAWRIIKDWVEAQMALIRVQMVTMEQVFLPFVQNTQGVTLYETLRDGKFQGLALPAPP